MIYNLLSISDPIFVSSVQKGSKIKAEIFNNILSEIKIITESLKENLSEDFAYYSKQLILIDNIFTSLPTYVNGELIDVSRFMGKLNLLRDEMRSLKVLIVTNKSKCQDYLNEDNTVSSGLYSLNDGSGNHYGTYCKFDGSNSYVLAATFANNAVGIWGNSSNSWNNTSENESNAIRPDVNNGSLKMKAWRIIKGSEFYLFNSFNDSELAVIFNYGSNMTMGEVFALPERTSCSASQAVAPDYYIPNSSWTRSVETCYLNYWKPNNYPLGGSTGRLRLMLQFSAASNGIEGNQNRVHWNSTRSLGGQNAFGSGYSDYDSTDWDISTGTPVHLYVKEDTP